MFNKRKIHTLDFLGRLGDARYISIDDVGMDLLVYGNLTSLVRGQRTKFARRVFAKSTRIDFHYLPGDEKFISTPHMFDQNSVWLCGQLCRATLNVGPKVKKFSLWYRVI